MTDLADTDREVGRLVRELVRELASANTELTIGEELGALSEEKSLFSVYIGGDRWEGDTLLEALRQAKETTDE